MLAKKYRLPIQTTLNKSGRTFRSRSFLIKSFLNGLGFNRFGVVISKKVDKRSIKRNLIKRIIFDLSGKFVHTKNADKTDILFIVSPAMIKTEKADIIKELEESLQKIIK